MDTMQILPADFNIAAIQSNGIIAKEKSTGHLNLQVALVDI